jgi:hypothetical protein
MCIGVIAYGMASANDVRGQLGAGTDMTPDQKERGASVVFVEQIKKLRRHRRVRTVVEG